MTTPHSPLSPARLAELSATYRDGLLNDIVPFWLRHGLDREHGGIMTALNRDGAVIDTDKGLWQQGRFVWLLATLYHSVEPREEWRAAAESTVNFIHKSGHTADDLMFFQVTREGKPLRRRRYVYTESFAAIALAAWSRISDDAEAREEAIAHFHRFVDYNRTPGWIAPKVDLATRPSQSLGPNLILINTARVLRDAIGFTEADTYIDEAIEIIERCFVNEEYQAVLETAGPEGEIIDHFDGRLLNPGHAIELAWFILHEAWQRGNDARLLALGCKILDWSWARGWDQEFGGILYFRDLQGTPGAGVLAGHEILVAAERGHHRDLTRLCAHRGREVRELAHRDPRLDLQALPRSRVRRVVWLSPSRRPHLGATQGQHLERPLPHSTDAVVLLAAL